MAPRFCADCGAHLVDGARFCAGCGSAVVTADGPSTGSETISGAGAWAPDPTGRYRRRWWDGTAWTSYVDPGDGGTYTDPLGAAPSPTEPSSAAAAVAPATDGWGSSSALDEGAKAPGLAGAAWPVVLLVIVGLSSIGTGIVRVVLFGSDAERGDSSPLYLVLTYALSFATTLAITTWIRSRRRRALGASLTRAYLSGAARHGLALLVASAAVLGPISIGRPAAAALAAGRSATPTQASGGFDYTTKFKEPVYVVVAKFEGRERVVMMAEEPKGDTFTEADGQGGSLTLEVISTKGPFGTPAEVCTASAGLTINGNETITSFGWQNIYWDCKNFKEQQKRTISTVVFGVLGVVLIGVGAGAGSVVTVGLGIGSAAAAAWIWLHGAPKPRNVNYLLEQMIKNSKEVRSAEQAARNLESASRGHMSEKDLREAADFTEQYLVRMTEQEKADFYRSQGVPVQSLVSQLKEIRSIKDR